MITLNLREGCRVSFIGPRFPYLSVGNGFSGTSSVPMFAEAEGQTIMIVCLAATPPSVAAGVVVSDGTT